MISFLLKNSYHRGLEYLFYKKAILDFEFLRKCNINEMQQNL